MTYVRRANIALILLAAGFALFLAMLVHSLTAAYWGNDRLNDSAILVHQLGLTDLALFTDARYSRHPSQADLNSAFQDHPMSLDHFPSGSLVSPSSFQFQNNGYMDWSQSQTVHK